MKAKLVSQVRQANYNLLSQLPLKMPFVLYVEPSGWCNKKCHFCPQTDPTFAMKKSMMKFPLWRKVMEEAKLWPERLKMLRVCGNGEPTMNKTLIPMLRLARTLDVAEKTEIVTNGTLLNHDLIMDLPRHVDRIVVSIYSLDLDDTALLKNLRKLYHHRGDAILHVKTFHQVANSEELRDKFFDYFGDFSDEIFIENVVPMWPEVAVEIPARTRWGTEIIPRRVCSQIFKGFQVQADGECVPCCVDWKRVNVIGNSNHQTLQEIWEGEPLRRLRQLHTEGFKAEVDPCRQCTMNENCDVDNIDEYRGEAF